MNFRPELAEKVMRGEKTVTRRACSPNPRSPWYRERCAKVPGRDYAVCPGRGKVAVGRVLIVSVERETFDPSSIDDDEAKREGFHRDDLPDFMGTPAEQFQDVWLELHGNLEPVECWRIEFEVKE